MEERQEKRRPDHRLEKIYFLARKRKLGIAFMNKISLPFVRSQEEFKRNRERYHTDTIDIVDV